MSHTSSPSHEESAKAPLDIAPSEKPLNHPLPNDVSDEDRKLIPAESGGLKGKSLIFACGAALFSDGYLSAIIGSCATLITSYDPMYADATTAEATRFTQLFSSLGFAGVAFAMLTFGFVVDKIGRKWGMLICSGILILFSILSAGAWGAGGSTSGLFAALIAYRFFLGIGIGGEYPSGSVACAENTEQANIKKSQQQGLFVFATNFAIDAAYIIGPLVVYVLYKIFGDDHIAWVWRLTLGFGAICPAILLLLRTKVQESTSYKRGAIRHKMPWWLIIKKYWLRLAAVSVVWFCYDFVSYPAGIYASYFTAEIYPDASLSLNLAFTIALNAGYLPGSFFGALVIDKLGPKRCIILFLALQAIFGYALAGSFGYFKTHTGGLIAMYVIYIALGEAGPGNCLGLLASKAVAPTPVRGVFYGIAAAIGKVGAFIGSYLFTSAQDNWPETDDMHYAITYYIGASLAVVALIAVVTCIPPVVSDGIVKMDEEFFAYLEANGYDMRNVGLAEEGVEPGRLSEDPASKPTLE